MTTLLSFFVLILKNLLLETSKWVQICTSSNLLQWATRGETINQWFRLKGTKSENWGFFFFLSNTLFLLHRPKNSSHLCHLSKYMLNTMEPLGNQTHSCCRMELPNGVSCLEFVNDGLEFATKWSYQLEENHNLP